VSLTGAIRILRDLRTLADRQRAAAFGIVGIMQELLQQLDPDYYREARLHMVHAELKRLRQARSALSEVETGLPSTTSRSGDNASQLLVRAAIVQSSSPEVNIRG
jgi:hypothetical protein